MQVFLCTFLPLMKDGRPWMIDAWLFRVREDLAAALVDALFGHN